MKDSADNGQIDLRQEGSNLASVAHTLVIGAFAVLSEKHSVLRTVNVEEWSYFGSVATVFLLSGMLKARETVENEGREIRTAALEELEKLHKGGLAAYEDLNSFCTEQVALFEKAAHDPTFQVSDSVGRWILWNITKRRPETDDEHRAVRVVGQFIEELAYQLAKPFRAK